MSSSQRIKREINVWAALKHPNINEFLGYSTDFADFPAMVSPVS
jgi:serine/threonine protein kinase